MWYTNISCGIHRAQGKRQRFADFTVIVASANKSEFLCYVHVYTPLLPPNPNGNCYRLIITIPRLITVQPIVVRICFSNYYLELIASIMRLYHH